MEIGKTIKIIEHEPAEDPIPVPEPVPVPEPQEEKELVPA